MEMAKNSSGAFCPPQHNISWQSAAVCRYGHARLCVMTRGVRAGETFEKVSPAHFQNFKTERLSRAERLRRLPSKGFTRRAPTKAQEVLRFRPPLRTD